MTIENPAFDYDRLGHSYSSQRQTDPRIAAYVTEALGNSRTILNVGAGAGSYEPDDRYVVAVEPSITMRQQRLRLGKVPALDAKAGQLPFDDQAFEAAMAMVTVHHWPDIEQGLREMRRVTKGPVLVLTFDPDCLDNFWNAAYFPEVIAVERARYPSLERIKSALGGTCAVVEIPIPLDCKDGFQEAFYGRPEAFLSKSVRLSQSAWGFIPDEQQNRMVQRLEADLQSGVWDARYGHFRTQPTFVCALRLLVAQPA